MKGCNETNKENIYHTYNRLHAKKRSSDCTSAHIASVRVFWSLKAHRKLRKDCLTFCCSNGRKPLNYGKRQDVTLSYNTNRLLDVLVLKFSAVNLARQKLLVVAKCYLWVGLLCMTQDHGVFDFDGFKRPFQEGCSFFRAMSKFTTWLCFKNNTAFSWVTRLRLIPFTYKKKKKP